MPENEQKYTDLQKIIDASKGDSSKLMPVMQVAQGLFGCVPLDVQEMIADGLGLTLSEVYGVATFYAQFALEPKGKYVVSVCLGTACYVKGSQAILDRICQELGTVPGKTSADGFFTIQATRCVGACGLAPVMTVNEEVYGRITPDDVPGILSKYQA